MLNVNQVEKVVKDMLPYADNHKVSWRGTHFSFYFDLAKVTHELVISQNTTSLQLVALLSSLAEDYWVSSGMKYFNEEKYEKQSWWAKLLNILRGVYAKSEEHVRAIRKYKL